VQTERAGAAGARPKRGETMTSEPTSEPQHRATNRAHRRRRAPALGSLIVVVSASFLVAAPRAQAVFTNCLGQAVTIKGDAGDNTITGTRGPDVILALGGNDTINGGGGNDVICGGTGDDHIDGQLGNDTIAGEAGKDVLIGNAGVDTINYQTETGPVGVGLASLVAKAADGVDTLASVENVTGSAFDDRIGGDDGPNTLRGLGGNDELIGQLGDDLLDGGGDVDTAAFNAIDAGVNADLSLGTADGQGTDTLLAIENLTGGAAFDELVGDAGPNTLNGLGGSDTISGGGGNDTLVGGEGDSKLFGGQGNDVLHGSSGALTGAADPLFSAGNNQLLGGGGNDILDGGAGNDVLDGGAGKDTAKFLLSFAVSVDLANGTANGQGVDSLVAIENLTGSSQDDVLVGDAKKNVIDGDAGTDTCDGNGGNDTLVNCP
jgi:Ca2+-binding RTX toxin-like protein